MKSALSCLLLISGVAAAQPPQALPVNENLAVDPGEDMFQRGKNQHDRAASLNDPQGRNDAYQQAAAILQEYIARFPNHPNTVRAFYYLANSLYMGGYPDQGKNTFHQVLTRSRSGDANAPFAAMAAYVLANDHYARKDYAAAAPLYERFAADTTAAQDKPRGYFYAGQCYRLLGWDRQALAAYKRVLDDPAGASLVPNAKYDSAQLLLKGDKPKEALAYLGDVIANTSSPAKLRGNAALVASVAAAKLGQTEQAEKHLNFVLAQQEMKELWPDAQTALMENAFTGKRYAEVIAIYRRNSVPAQGEKEASRLMIAARAYMEQKKPAEAQVLFRQVESLVSPENELAFRAAYYRLHCFYQIEGRHVPDQVDGFLEIYRKTRPADDPRIHTALFIKAENLFADRKIDEAAEVFREINVDALSEENRPGLLYKRGWCLAEKDDAAGAIRSFSEFLSRYPKDERRASVLAKRAKCYADMGEAGKAIADFDQLTGEGIPEELSSFAWLESARMRYKENNLQDMVLRYKGLLSHAGKLDGKLQAEANFCIGLGAVKLNAPADAVPYLEKARSIDSAGYGKRVGLLLAFAYHSLQDSQKLSAEINLAIDGNYVSDISDQTIQWAGMQAYGGGDYKSAARFLGLIANADDPRATVKEIWRYLGKARLETDDGAGALVAADNVLAVEDQPAWKADGLVDRGRALLMVNRPEDARKAADEADDLNPQGRTKALLDLLSGDLHAKAGEWSQAAGAYSPAALFGADVDLKPLALHKLADAWEKAGNKAEAEKHRATLAKDFPNWKAP